MASQPSQAAMKADQAVRLVNAWEGKSGSTQPAKLLIAPNGDFSHQSHGAFFHYEGAAQRLIASGFVGQKMLQFTAAREPWEELQFYAAREKETLGEGSFEVISTPLFDLAPPVLLLRKSFGDGSIGNAQFVLEVRWLLEWATHWRSRRLLEINSADTPEVIARKGQVHVEFAKNHRTRPW